MARPGRRRGGGIQPLNALGSKKLRNSSPLSSPTSSNLTKPKAIESDATLLLAAAPKRSQRPRVYQRYASAKARSGNEKFIKSTSENIEPVYKIQAVSKNSRPTRQSTLFSDDDTNDMHIQREIPLDLEEYEPHLKLQSFNTIRFIPGKILFGDGDAIGDSSTLIVSFRTDLSSMKVLIDKTLAADFNLSKTVKAIYFSDTKLFITLQKPIEIQNSRSDSILLYIGASNGKSLKTIWKQLKVVQNDPEIFFNEVKQQGLFRTIKNQNLSRLAQIIGGSGVIDSPPTRLLSTSRPATISQFLPVKPLVPRTLPSSAPSADRTSNIRESSLKGKDFKSLRKKPTKVSEIGKASRISTPKDKTENASFGVSADESSNVSAFYSPVGSRLTRSISKTAPPDSQPLMLLDDPDVSISRSRGKRELFKPSLVYKFRDNSSYKIKNLDFQCLYRGQWINDTLIDFFLKYFAENAIDKGNLTEESLHIFTTFFFTKLKSTPRHYENIERWVSKIDFSKKEYVVVPINESLHWYCSIIVNFDKILQKDDTDSKCTIYVFDSLRQEHIAILKPLRSFLVKYAKEKFDVDVGNERIQLRPSSVPKQPNFNDCGIHVMYNVLRFLDAPKECLNVWDAEKEISRATLSNFFKKKDREDMRERLRDILKQLQSEQAHRTDDSDTETGENLDEDDEDDLVYINADEFHDLKNKIHRLKEHSAEIEEASGPENDQNDRKSIEVERLNNDEGKGDSTVDEKNCKSDEGIRHSGDSQKEDVEMEDAIAGYSQREDSTENTLEEVKKKFIEETQEIPFSSYEGYQHKHITTQNKKEVSDDSKSQEYFPTIEDPKPNGESDDLEEETTHDQATDSRSDSLKVEFSSDIIQLKTMSQDASTSRREEPQEQVPGTQESQDGNGETKDPVDILLSSPGNTQEPEELMVDHDQDAASERESKIEDESNKAQEDEETKVIKEITESKPVYQDLNSSEPEDENHHSDIVSEVIHESQVVHHIEEEEANQEANDVENGNGQQEIEERNDQKDDEIPDIIHIDTYDALQDQSEVNTHIDEGQIMKDVDDSTEDIEDVTFNHVENDEGDASKRTQTETIEVKTPEKQVSNLSRYFEDNPASILSSPLSPVPSISDSELDIHDVEPQGQGLSRRKFFRPRLKRKVGTTPETMDLTSESFHQEEVTPQERPSVRRSIRRRRRQASPSIDITQELVDVEQEESYTPGPDADDDVVEETPSTISKRRRQRGKGNEKQYQEETKPEKVEQVIEDDNAVVGVKKRKVGRPPRRSKQIKVVAIEDEPAALTPRSYRRGDSRRR